MIEKSKRSRKYVPKAESGQSSSQGFGCHFYGDVRAKAKRMRKYTGGKNLGLGEVETTR